MEVSQLQSESNDYISDLPDNVLHYILSFLPRKDCIRTSFLSRRWRYLWTTVPSLDFDGFVFSPKVKFMKFVDSVLLRRVGCGIHTFRLRFGDYYCESSRVHSWIISAVGHSVCDLSISSHTSKPLDDLPSCIFTCRSLTTLTLKLPYSNIKLPSSCHLPFLKTLKLSSIISDDNLTQFFSTCQMLETVIMQDCFVRNLTTLHISSPYLQRLYIDGVPPSFHGDGLLKEIRISTPRLLSLECRDICLERDSSLTNANISLENMSSLVNASFNFAIHWENSKQICAPRVSHIFRGLSNVKVLALSSETIQRWLDNDQSFELQKADFVTDHLKVVEIREFRGDVRELAFVKYLLQHAPILERMIIVFSKQLSSKSERRIEIQEGILMHPRSSMNTEIICSMAGTFMV